MKAARREEMHRDGERNRKSVTDCALRILSFLLLYPITLSFLLLHPDPPTHTPAVALSSSLIPSLSSHLSSFYCMGGQLCSSSHFELYRSVGDCVCMFAVFFCLFISPQTMDAMNQMWTIQDTVVIINKVIDAAFPWATDEGGKINKATSWCKYTHANEPW